MRYPIILEVEPGDIVRVSINGRYPGEFVVPHDSPAPRPRPPRPAPPRLTPREQRRRDRTVRVVAIALWAQRGEETPYPGPNTDVGAEVWRQAEWATP